MIADARTVTTSRCATCMDYWQGAIRKIATADVTTIPPDLLHEQVTWQRLPLSSRVAEGWQECSPREGTWPLRPDSRGSSRAFGWHRTCVCCSPITANDEGQHSFRLELHGVEPSRVMLTDHEFLSKVYRVSEHARADWTWLGVSSAHGRSGEEEHEPAEDVFSAQGDSTSRACFRIIQHIICCRFQDWEMTTSLPWWPGSPLLP